MIWKWDLSVTDRQEIEMPARSRPLTVQIQRGIPRLWAIVNPDAERVRRSVYIVGTGNPMPEIINACTYIGTAQMSFYVWHFFITPEEEPVSNMDPEFQHGVTGLPPAPAAPQTEDPKDAQMEAHRREVGGAI